MSCCRIKEAHLSTHGYSFNFFFFLEACMVSLSKLEFLFCDPGEVIILPMSAIQNCVLVTYDG